MTKRHVIAVLTLCSIAPLARADEAADAKAAVLACIKGIIENDTAAISANMAGDPADAAAAKSLSGMFAAQKALTDAAAKKYGADAIKNDPQFANPAKQIEKLQTASVTVTGDKAVMHPPGSTQDDMKLSKIDGQWKITTLFGRPEARDQVTKMMPAMTEVLTGVTKGIEAGEFATVNDVKKAMGQRVMAIAMKNAPAGAKVTTRPAQ